MSAPDAYRDEMRRLRRLSDSDLHRVLAGRAPAGDAEAEELAAFARAARAGLLGTPSEATEARHLSAIVAAVRKVDAPGRPVESKRRAGFDLPPLRRTALRVALAAGSLVLVTAGLAVAGVRLPEPAVSVLEDLGVQLPNQPDEAEPPSEERETRERAPAPPAAVPVPGGAPARPPATQPPSARPEPDRVPTRRPLARGRPESPPSGAPPVERGRPESVPPSEPPSTPGRPESAPKGGGPPSGAPGGPPDSAGPQSNMPFGGVGARPEGRGDSGAEGVAPQQPPPEEG